MSIYFGGVSVLAVATAVLFGVADADSPNAPDVATSAYSGFAFAPQASMAVPPALRDMRTALADDGRFRLANRLLGTSCVLRRDGRQMSAVGACEATFGGADRIAGWRVADDRVTMTDVMGSAVLTLAWNDETGMASLPSQSLPETGALALIPVGN